MHWNYRLVNTPSENGGEDWFELKEVYYSEVTRLWALAPHPEETDDERLLKDYKRGVPLLTLSKERGSTRERTRHRLKKIGAIT